MTKGSFLPSLMVSSFDRSTETNQATYEHEPYAK